MTNSVAEPANVKSRFAEFMKKQQEEAEKPGSSSQSNNSNQKKEYKKREDLQWLSLESGKETVFRILGNPPDFRQNNWDIKKVFISEIIDDKGSKRRVIWKQNQRFDSELNRKVDDGTLDEDFILYQIYSKVVDSGHFDPDAVDAKGQPYVTKSGKQGKFIKDYEDTDSYTWVVNNKSLVKKSDFALHFRPSKSGEFIMNVISRMDDWCEINKHSMLLTRKMGVTEKDGKTSFYPKNGITGELFNHILQKVQEFDKENGYENVDVVIKKTSTKNSSNKTEDTYDVADIQEKTVVLKARNIEITYPLSNGKQGELSEEEKNYKKYNLNFHFAPTSYKFILSNFSERIKQVDADTGSKFYDTLVSLELEEQALREIKKQEYLTWKASQSEQGKEEPIEGSTDSSNEEDIPF